MGPAPYQPVINGRQIVHFPLPLFGGLAKTRFNKIAAGARPALDSLHPRRELDFDRFQVDNGHDW